MAKGSFTLKTIRVIVETEGSGQVLDVWSLPVSVKVAKTGGEENSSASITIYNLASEKVQQLTALLFKDLIRPRTTVKVYAGDKGTPLSLVYEGDVTQAVPKFDVRGNLSITLTCIVGYFSAHGKAVNVCVGEGGMSLESLLYQITGEEFVKSLSDAVKSIWIAAGTVFVGDLNSVLYNIMYSYNVNITREGDDIKVSQMLPPATDVFVLSRETGLLGYPSFTGSGVTCKAIFNPNFKVQTFFRINSLLPGTDGIWQVTKAEYSLEANMPKGGDWTMVVTAWFKGTDGSSGAIAAQDDEESKEPAGTTDTASGSGGSSGEATDTTGSSDAGGGLTQQEINVMKRDFEDAVANGNESLFEYDTMRAGEPAYSDSQLSAVLSSLNKSIVTAGKLVELGYPKDLIADAGYKL